MKTIFKFTIASVLCIGLFSNQGCGNQEDKEEFTTQESQVCSNISIDLKNFKEDDNHLSYDYSNDEDVISIWALKYNQNSSPKYVIVKKNISFMDLIIEVKSCDGQYLYESSVDESYNSILAPNYINDFINDLKDKYYSNNTLKNEEYNSLKESSFDHYVQYFLPCSRWYLFGVKNDWIEDKYNEFESEGIDVLKISMVNYYLSNDIQYVFHTSNGNLTAFDCYGWQLIYGGDNGASTIEQEITDFSIFN